MTFYKTAKNESGDTCWFDQKTHRYRVESTGEELTSVTKFVKSFFEPFDADRIANRIADRRGVTPEWIRAEWNAKRDEAATLGTRTHENLEDWIHGRSHRHAPRHEHERAVFATAWNALSAIRANYRILQAEKMVFSADLKLAGTIDALATDPDGTLWLLDWKSNAAIKTEPFGAQAGLAPITDLPDCNLTHYGLQLATYEAILRHGGYVRLGQRIERALIHLKPDGPQWIPTPDLSASVGAMVGWTRVQGYHDVPF